MRSVLLILAAIALVGGIWGSAIWAFVSFVVYIAKDIPFNWWSVGSFIFFLTIAILMELKFNGIIKRKKK